MPEFQPYLDAVTRSGERTRRVIYVLLLMLTFDVAFFTRFVYPDWNGSRTELRIDALNCYDAALKVNAAEGNQIKADAAKAQVNWRKCHELLWIMAKLHYPLVLPDYSAAPKESGWQKWLSRWNWLGISSYDPYRRFAAKDAHLGPLDLVDPLDRHVDRYVGTLREIAKAEYDDLAVGIPFFGAQFDANDFWLFSGVLMCFLFQILRQHLDRELRNLRIADSACPNDRCRELMLMEVVLTAPPARVQRVVVSSEGTAGRDMIPDFGWVPINAFLQSGLLFVMIFLPPLLNMINCLDDLGSTNITLMSEYNGEFRMTIQYIFQASFVVVLGYICWACFRGARELQNQVTQIAGRVYPA